MPDWLDNIKKLTDELPEEKRAEATKALEKVFKPDNIKRCQDLALDAFWAMIRNEDYYNEKNYEKQALSIMDDFCKCMRRYSR